MYLVNISYFFSVIIFFNFSSSFIFWFWLEFNMILFISVMVSNKNYLSELDIFSQCLYYFILQSFFSIILLFMVHTDFFIFSSFMIVSIIFMKLGVIPFHFWTFKISSYLSSVNLFLMLNIQKIPLLIFLALAEMNFVLFFLVFNLIFSCLFILYSNTFIEFMVSSSLCFFNWFFFIFIWSILGFIVFFFKYLVFNYIFLELKKFSGAAEKNIYMGAKIVFLIVFLMGLPPFIYFFFKVYLVCLMMKASSFMLIFLIWIFSFFSLISYFNYLVAFIFKTINKYSSFHYLLKKDIYIFISILMSMFLYT